MSQVRVRRAGLPVSRKRKHPCSISRCAPGKPPTGTEFASKLLATLAQLSGTEWGLNFDPRALCPMRTLYGRSDLNCSETAASIWRRFWIHPQIHGPGCTATCEMRSRECVTRSAVFNHRQPLCDSTLLSRTSIFPVITTISCIAHLWFADCSSFVERSATAVREGFFVSDIL